MHFDKPYNMPEFSKEGWDISAQQLRGLLYLAQSRKEAKSYIAQEKVVKMANIKEVKENVESKKVEKTGDGKKGNDGITDELKDKSVSNRLRELTRYYTKAEDVILGTLELGIDQFDNFILLQTFIPRLRQKNKGRVGKIINLLVRHLSRFYIVVILINCRRLVVRLIKVNKIVRQLELQCRIMSHQSIVRDFQIPKHLKDTLMQLYTMKVKVVVELIGYLGELMLNLDMVWKKMHIPARVKKLLSVLSWIVGIYRFAKDADDDAKMDSSLAQISDRYC